MNRAEALRDRQRDLITEGHAIFDAAEAAGNRDLTAEEATRDDAINAELTRLEAEIGREDARRAREVALASRDPAPAITGGHDRAADRPFASLGEQLATIYRATVNRDGDARERLLAVATGASEAVDSDGGYMLQPDYAAGLDTAMRTGGEILSRVSTIGVSAGGLVERQIAESSRVDGSRAGGVRGYWVDEAVAPTASRPTFRRFKTELAKLAALGYATDELLEDFPAMSGLFMEEFANELRFKVEDAIVEGDGSGKPLGFATTANPALISVAADTNQAAKTITTSNLSNMWVRMHSRGRANAVWFINQDVEPQLDILSIPAGTAALEPRFVAYDQTGLMRIKGRPVVAIEYASTLGTVNDLMLVDLAEYRFIDRGGVNSATSAHVAFTTDEMAFRVTYRCGGQPKWLKAMTPFKGSTTVSPFITLATRA